MQFSPHKPHNVPERFAASVAKVCTTAFSIWDAEKLSEFECTTSKEGMMKTALILIGLGLQMKQSLCKSCRHVQAACALFRRVEEQRMRPAMDV